MEEDWSRGFQDSARLVCARHFDDDILLAAQAEGATSGTCDFCDDGIAPRVSDLTNVVKVVALAFFEYWSDADNEGIPWDSGEGGYQGSVLDVGDAFEMTFEDELSDEPEVWREIMSCFYTDAMVCQRNYWELTDEAALRFDWKEFTDTIKYRTRYVFLAEPAIATGNGSEEGQPPPAMHMLARVAELLERYGCIRPMVAGERWYRARVHRPDVNCSNAAALATVPDDLATIPNRMSPAGIPMFYGAADVVTALAEVWTPGTRGRVATSGVFRTTREMLIVDLTRLPQLPSIFATERRAERDHLLFLRAFIDELRQPIARDGREHIEYVPTQVVTEYCRRVARRDQGQSVDGLLFRSSQDPE
jgi:hypothetical protein